MRPSCFLLVDESEKETLNRKERKARKEEKTYW
jgi:hypothetical protein